MDSIFTKRLRLASVTMNDYVFMRQLVNTEGWLRFIGDRHVHTDDQARAYIDRILHTPNLTYWVVWHNQLNVPTGIISLIKRDYLEHFDIGFAFLPEYQRHGYALEGAQVIMEHTQQRRITTLLATIIPGNVRSINLLERLGFSFDQKMEINHDTIWVYKIQMG